MGRGNDRTNEGNKSCVGICVTLGHNETKLLPFITAKTSEAYSCPPYYCGRSPWFGSILIVCKKITVYTFFLALAALCLTWSGRLYPAALKSAGSYNRHTSYEQDSNARAG